MNNKGFSLVELLITLSIISFIFIVAFSNIDQTFSMSEEKSYEVTKDNIKSAANSYILECENKIIDCSKDFKWQESNITKSTSFSLDALVKRGYFKTDNNVVLNPITDKPINECLIVDVDYNKITGIYEYQIDDKLCEK